MGWSRKLAVGVVIVCGGLGSGERSVAQEGGTRSSLPALLASAGVVAVGLPVGIYTHRECDSGLCQSAFTDGLVLGATLGAGAGWLLGRGLQSRGDREPGSRATHPRGPVVGSASFGPVHNPGSAEDYLGLSGVRLSVGVPVRSAWTVGMEVAGHQLRQDILLGIVDGSGQRRPTDRQLRIRTVGVSGSGDLTAGGALRLTGVLGAARARYRETVAVPASGQVRGDILDEGIDWGLHSGVGLMAGWTVPGTGVRAGFQARMDWVSDSRLGSVATVGWSLGVWN